jgi:CPA1 family monovalent cation:H+ antiporter
VIGWLKLDRLSPIDEALSRQVVAVGLQTVREELSRTTEAYALTREIVRSEAKAFGERLDEAVGAAEDSDDILDRDRITLGLIALAGFERDTILARVKERTISARMADQILSDADQLIEAARAGGRSSYQKAARRSIAYGLAFRGAVVLHNRLGLSRWLVRMTADRFERLLSQRLILRDIDTFIDGRIRRIHGRRVADLLHELIARRVEGVTTALEGLRLQFPGYVEELERRFIRRTALRLEEREYTIMRDDGLIGAEVYATLIQNLADRRTEAEARPRLDIAVQRVDLIRQFPIFSDLDDRALKALGRSLKTIYVDAGSIVMRKDTPAKSVFFIASGAVELESAGQTWRLGRGDMFGQMALLLSKARRAEVRAIAPSTLLVLDEARFRSLLSRSAALQDAVRASATQRGISLDLLSMKDVGAK